MSKKLRSAIEVIEKSLYSNRTTSKSVANKVGVSVRQLERLFTREFGSTPGRFMLKARLDRAARLIRQTDLSVAEVSQACGFVSPSHFSKVYREAFARSPRFDRMHYREKIRPLSRSSDTTSDRDS